MPEGGDRFPVAAVVGEEPPFEGEVAPEDEEGEAPFAIAEEVTVVGLTLIVDQGAIITRNLSRFNPFWSLRCSPR